MQARDVQTIKIRASELAGVESYKNELVQKSYKGALDNCKRSYETSNLKFCPVNNYIIYTVPQGTTLDEFSDFVGFIVSYRRLCGFLDSPSSLSSLLASFCELFCSWNWKFDYNTML